MSPGPWRPAGPSCAAAADNGRAGCHSAGANRLAAGDLTGDERDQVLHAWNDTTRAYSSACLHEQFEAEVVTMRACQYVEIGAPPQVVDVPRPQPGPGQVLLRLEPASVGASGDYPLAWTSTRRLAPQHRERGAVRLDQFEPGEAEQSDGGRPDPDPARQ